MKKAKKQRKNPADFPEPGALLDGLIGPMMVSNAIHGCSYVECLLITQAIPALLLEIRATPLGKLDLGSFLAWGDGIGENLNPKRPVGRKPEGVK